MAAAESPDILECSPLDQAHLLASDSLEAEVEAAQWVASRFNVQNTTEDGQLIVWNTLHGSISAFPAKHRVKIRSLLTRRPFEARAEGMVGYLRERGFLVKEGTDEYRSFLLRFGQQHYRTDRLVLALLGSEDCNFRCEYCYERFARGTMLPWVRSGVKKYVESRLPGLRYLKVTWYGGEPLYGFEAIEDLGPYFYEIAQKHSIVLKSAITTNGYLLTPGVVDKLLSWQINEMQITIDGLPENHDRLRRTRDGQGSFATIFDNIKALRQRTDDFTINLRINFNPQSEPHLDNFLDLLGEEFGNDPRFRLFPRPVGCLGGARDGDLQVNSAEEARLITNRLTEEAHKRGLKSFDDVRKIGRFGAQVCSATYPDTFVVGADGKLMKCGIALDTKETNIVGRIKPDGGLELDQDKMAWWCEPRFLEAAKCKKCVILPICQNMLCPYQRIRDKKTYCSPLRRNLKSSLGWAPKFAGADERKIAI